MTTPRDPYRQNPRYRAPAPPQPRRRQPQQGQPYSPPPPGQPHYRRPAPDQRYYQQPEQRGYYPAEGYEEPRKPKRKRRIFLWVFLGVQAMFILWLVVGLASKGSGPSVASQVAQQCAGTGWQGLFKSHADCVTHYTVALNDAGNTGKGIGAALIVLVWVVVDFFMGVGYGIYKLASR